MLPNPQFPADLNTFTEKSLMKNFIFWAVLPKRNSKLSGETQKPAAPIKGIKRDRFFNFDNDPSSYFKKLLVYKKV